MTKPKKKPAPSLDARVDAMLAAVIGAVDYDHGKQLDPATAEEPDEVEHNRSFLRNAFEQAMRDQGLTIGFAAPRTNAARPK